MKQFRLHSKKIYVTAHDFLNSMVISLYFENLRSLFRVLYKTVDVDEFSTVKSIVPRILGICTIMHGYMLGQI